ncbi:hypothetical protein [Deinococcus sp.]|uniref:hypothetical protein n=1 Tax=Deinococcus sp. TaxID=47478 RepID=UPI0025BA5A32|nr:hypothetical protein [Deinococcus sp.]
MRFYVIEGALPTFIAGLKPKVGGQTVCCVSDLSSTYSRALTDRQVAACKSVKAKWAGQHADHDGPYFAFRGRESI